MSSPISYHELVHRVGIEFLPNVMLKRDVADVSTEQGTTATTPSTAAPATNADTTCYTGPRGGTYTLTPSGKKNYGGC